MNHIEIEIGGALRGLKFNNYAVEEFQRKIFKNFGSVVTETKQGFEENNTATVYALFYAGLKANCFSNDIEADFTYADVENWVDELYAKSSDDIRKVSDLYVSTQAYKAWMEKVSAAVASVSDKEKDKKKAAKK